MPLTIAHPAAGYPLRRWLARPGALEAFVIGSMIPDLPYFVPFGATGVQSHSPAGLLWYCAPAGTAVWALYRVLFRDVLRALLPANVRARLSDATRPAWARAILPAAAFVLIGAATHIGWDWFTHQSWLVRSFPALGASVGLRASLALPAFVWLQYVSTVAGLSGMLFWARRWYGTASVRPHPAGQGASLRLQLVLWTVLLVPAAATALAIVGRGVLAAPPQTLRAAHQLVSRALFAGGSAGLGTLLVVSIVWRIGGRSPGSRAAVERRLPDLGAPRLD